MGQTGQVEQSVEVWGEGGEACMRTIQNIFYTNIQQNAVIGRCVTRSFLGVGLPKGTQTQTTAIAAALRQPKNY